MHESIEPSRADPIELQLDNRNNELPGMKAISHFSYRTSLMEAQSDALPIVADLGQKRYPKRNPRQLLQFHQPIRQNLRSMDKAAIQSQIAAIEGKREFLVRLLERTDLGTLRIDVNQALEEMDDLIEEFRRTFPNGD